MQSWLKMIADQFFAAAKPAVKVTDVDVDKRDGHVIVRQLFEL